MHPPKAKLRYKMFSKKSWSPYEDAILKNIIQTDKQINWDIIKKTVLENYNQTQNN